MRGAFSSDHAACTVAPSAAPKARGRGRAWGASTPLPLPNRQGVGCSEYNNGDDDGQGNDLFHVDVGSQPRPSKQLGACFERFQQRVCIWNRAAAGVTPCAGADRLGHDSGQISDSPAGFLESVFSSRGKCS
jgi:hypothetical protein